ncbi:MAG TPA: hypothetical protein VJ417_00055, partial [Candidatus Glassbacteria bacterium]|nr:hypothetical protein [Candidatus Glassbacteria bacterium]
VGVKARVWEVHSHTVSEAWYENAWHMLDSDIGLYYLMDDNRTIASVEQLWADQKVSEGLEEKANLTKYSGRNKAIFLEYTDAEGNNAYVSQDGVRQRGYRYFHDNYYCFVQKGYEKFTNAAHTMAITLRPNEKIIRNWKGGDKFYDYERHKRDYERNNSPESVPIRYGDGKLIWKTDLASKDACLYVNREFPPAFMADDGQYPPIHVKHRQGGIYDFPTRAFFDISSPYTILGGRLRATVHRGGASEWDGIETVIYNEEKELNERVWQAPQDTTGKLEMDVSLNETLYPSGQKGLHDYSVQFQFSANEKNDPPTQTGIESVELKTDIQVAPNSLPALTLGRNVIRYRDETPGPHRVKITHVWRERSDNHPPLAPAVALYPADGVTVDDLAPNFRWKSAADQDRGDSIANHWIRISFDPQCRWPVATALMKVTDSPK